MNTEIFSSLVNLDLLSVGVAVAGMVILGFAVFFTDVKSISNRIFLGLALATSVWGSLNYFSYQPNDPYVSFLFLRWAIFFAVISSFFTFTFSYVFPSTQKQFPGWFRWRVLPVVATAALATLTPFVFRGISTTAPDGHVTGVDVAPGLFLFALTIIFLNIGSLLFLIGKLMSAQTGRKMVFRIILMGMFVMLALVVVFNLILPAFFENTRFIPFGALFLFPFIAMTSYAVLRHKLFNIKVTSTAVLVFALSIVMFGEIIFAKEAFLVIYRASVFTLVLTLGILLIRGVIREVRQREEIQILADSLKKANERLKELDKLKNQFLSIASHDLRAPLTTVRNFMSLLLEGAYGKLPQAAEEGMRRVFDQATEMAKSVDNYLNVSRIEQGRMKYEFEKADLVKVLSESVEPFKSIAEKKGVSFDVRRPADLKEIFVKADSAKLREVFSLLIDNSIKYTPQGSVTVSIERQDKKARITIKDTGVGMSKETIENKLFKLFSTAEDARKVNTSSTGVGLYVVKAHIEAHKGKVWAESGGEGKGSAFIVELPLLS